MVNYKAIEILTNETARYRSRPLPEAVVQYVRDQKIAARCIVTRGVAGCYEDGEITTGWLEVLSYNMPVRIYIVLPAAEADLMLKGLEGMIEEGIVVLHDLNVQIHKVKNSFFPRHLKVLDVMTRKPSSVSGESLLSDAARLLLSSIFTGLPVVDGKGRPIGVITQGDLIRKGGMPLRLGLIAESEKNGQQSLLKTLAGKRAMDAMTTPAITIEEESLLSKAVDLMVKKNVKRLPVVDGSGKLTGMVSRLDIFQTVMREAPDWKSFSAQKIEVKSLKRVGAILRRDTHAVTPETSIEEVMRVIDQNDIQRVAVVDGEGKLLGLISDRDLLSYFKPEEAGFLSFFSKVKESLKEESSGSGLKKRLAETLAGDIMNTNLITVHEEMPIEAAIGIMIEKSLKRLPVVDKSDRFQGMISRDSLLRTGFFDTPSHSGQV